MTKKQKRDREHAIKSYLKGESITAIAAKVGYSRRWVYKWIQRYEAAGEESHWEEDKTKRPHCNPRQLPELVVEAVKLARASLVAEGNWRQCNASRCRAFALSAESSVAKD
jgi:transposase